MERGKNMKSIISMLRTLAFILSDKPLKGENDMLSFTETMSRHFFEETSSKYLKDTQPY